MNSARRFFGLDNTCEYSRPGKIARILLLVLLSIELLYVVGVNSVLMSDRFQQRLNLTPEKLLINWGSLYSPFPGYIYGADLVIRSQTSRVQSYTEIERFGAWLVPIGLLERNVTIGRTRLHNLRTRIRPSEMADRVDPDLLGFFPSIPGLSPPEKNVPAPTGPFKPGWSFNLSNIVVSGTHEMHLANYRMKGAGYLRGNLEFQLHGEMSIDQGQASLEAIEMLLDDKKLINKGAITGHFQVHPYPVYFYPGVTKMSFMDIDASIEADLENLDVLNYYLGTGKHSNWPGISAAGRLGGRVALDKGVLASQTKMTFDSGAITYRTDKFSIESSGRIELVSGVAEAGRRKLLDFSLENLLVRHLGTDKPVIAANGVRFGVSGNELKVGAPMKNLRIDATLDHSDIPDLTALNGLIPTSAQVVVKSGQGEVSGSLTWMEGHMSGDLQLISDGLGMRIKKHDLTAGLKLLLSLQANMEERSISIDGSAINIENAKLAGELEAIEPWRGKFLFEKAQISLLDDVDLKLTKKGGFMKLVNFTDGEMRLTGSVSDIGLVNHLIASDDRLELSGKGDYRARLSMVRGRISAGSFVEYHSKQLSATFLDFVARGDGRVNTKFREQGKKRRLEIVTSLADVQLMRREGESIFVNAPLITFHISGRSDNLVDPLENIDVQLNIPEATVPDITVYNHYLPQNGAIRLLSGQGLMRSRLSLDDTAASGQIQLTAPSVASEVNGQTLSFDLDMQINLSGGELQARTFSLDQSYMKLDNLRKPDFPETPEDWSAIIRFEEGQLIWKFPLSMTAKTTLNMTSTAPLVELFIGQSGYTNWIRQILSVRDVRGRAWLDLKPDDLVINNLEILGEDIQISAKLRVTEGGGEGVIYNRLGRLAATVEFDEEQREWHILSALKHFDNHPGY